MPNPEVRIAFCCMPNPEVRDVFSKLFYLCKPTNPKPTPPKFTIRFPEIKLLTEELLSGDYGEDLDYGEGLLTSALIISNVPGEYGEHSDDCESFYCALINSSCFASS